MQREALVTGLGIVNALGSSPNRFWEQLLAGTCAFRPVTVCDVSRSSSKIGAEVTDFSLLRYLAKGAGIARSWSRPAQFALAASLQALADAGFNMTADADRIGVYVGTSVGNMADVFSMHDQYRRTGLCRASFGFHTFHHSIACLVSATLDCRGPAHTTTSGCNSGLDAIGQAARLVCHGDADAMLVIGTDCELVKEVFSALEAAGALSTRYNDRPHEASRPFDVDRDGNVLGEGAAALLVENGSSARARGAKVYARVQGFANRAAGRNREYRHDAPDLDASPAVRTLRAAIDDAGWRPADVDLINANGSSSRLYDVLEAQAFHGVFGADLVRSIPVHSIKAMLGQHGAGSAAFQSLSACLSLATGLVPPTINCVALDPRCGDLQVLTVPTRLDPERVLVHAIGFGGFYYTALAFERVEPSDADLLDGVEPPQVQWSPDTLRLEPSPDLM